MGWTQRTNYRMASKKSTKTKVGILAKVYMEVLETRTYPEGNNVFQQDSAPAPAHKAKVTQNFMDENFAEYCPWALWPPSSPFCNHLDYAIWGVMEVKVGATPYRNVDDLKASICRECSSKTKQE